MNIFISKPQSYKTKEIISALQFRQDQKIVLIGDTQGKISLIPRQTSFRPLSVFNSRSKVTSIQFSPFQSTEFACSNTNNQLLWWSLSEYRKSKFTIRKAHQDIIKQISYSNTSPNVVYSISYDRTMRKWDTRQKINPESSIILKNDQPFQTLCFIPGENSNQFLTGSGRCVKLWDLRNLVQNVMSKQVHSKTVSKLAYYKKQSRILSASHDGNLRILSISDKISSIYGIKYGSEILSLDTSDNDAFAVGAYNGGLWSLQKSMKNQNLGGDGDDDQEKMFQFSRIQRSKENTGKSKTYFNRGAYDKFADVKYDDNSRYEIVGAKSQKKQDKITKCLKKFQYKLALDYAIKEQNILKIITLVKELQLRNGLDIALKDRSSGQIEQILRVINWKIMDDRYTETMCTLLNRILHIYTYSLQYDKKIWNEMQQLIGKSQKFSTIATKMIEIKGQIDSLLFIIQNITQ